MAFSPSNIVERLTYFSGWSARKVRGIELGPSSILCWDAIDTIHRLEDALKQTVDYISEGSPDDSRQFVLTEARAALGGLSVVPISMGVAPAPAVEKSP